MNTVAGRGVEARWYTSFLLHAVSRTDQKLATARSGHAFSQPDLARPVQGTSSSEFELERNICSDEANKPARPQTGSHPICMLHAVKSCPSKGSRRVVSNLEYKLPNRHFLGMSRKRRPIDQLRRHFDRRVTDRIAHHPPTPPADRRPEAHQNSTPRETPTTPMISWVMDRIFQNGVWHDSALTRTRAWAERRCGPCSHT